MRFVNHGLPPSLGVQRDGREGKAVLAKMIDLCGLSRIVGKALVGRDIVVVVCAHSVLANWRLGDDLQGEREETV